MSSRRGRAIDDGLAQRSPLSSQWIDVRPHVTDEIRHLAADEEERFIIAQANVRLNPDGTLGEELISARHGERFLTVRAEQVDYIDVSPKQTMSVAGALIPFLEHDDANRALMGCNMQRQAVPLLKPSAPLVGTGMEERTARDSGQVALSPVDGVVESVTSEQIVVRDEHGQLQAGACGSSSAPTRARASPSGRSWCAVSACARISRWRTRRPPTRASWRSVRTCWWRS